MTTAGPLVGHTHATSDPMNCGSKEITGAIQLQPQQQLQQR